jgi:Fibronectin type III domain
MVTTLLVRLQKVIGCLTRESLCLKSMAFRLMIVCIPPLTGCGDGETSQLNDLAAAEEPSQLNDMAEETSQLNGLAMAMAGRRRSTTTTVSASLTWDAGTNPSIIGYHVHYGTQSPNSVGSCAYAQSIYYSLDSLANASSPSVTISSLATDTTYYFAVSAYNGIESACSNEVSKAT